MVEQDNDAYQDRVTRAVIDSLADVVLGLESASAPLLFFVFIGLAVREPTRIETTGRGEREPAVPTADIPRRLPPWARLTCPRHFEGPCRLA